MKKEKYSMRRRKEKKKKGKHQPPLFHLPQVTYNSEEETSINMTLVG